MPSPDRRRGLPLRVPVVLLAVLLIGLLASAPAVAAGTVGPTSGPARLAGSPAPSPSAAAGCGGGPAGWACTAGRWLSNPSAAAGGALAGIASDAFGQMARQFGDAAIWLLRQLADAFTAASTVDLGASGVRQVLTLTTPIAAVVALLLLVWTAGGAAFSADGSRLGAALVGLAKTVLIAGLIVAVTQVGLRAADDVSAWLINATLGGPGGLHDRLAGLVGLSAVTGNAALVLVFALVAIVATVLLIGELLLRHVAIVVLVAAAPIAAAGLVGHATAGWWAKTRAALISLIVLKPVIALLLAVGFGAFAGATDLLGLLSGLLTLVLAGLAWPMLARFLTFTSVGGGAALFSSVTGFGAGLLGGRAAGGGAPAAGPAAAWGPDLAVALERDGDASRTGSAAGLGAAAVGTAKTGPATGGAGATTGATTSGAAGSAAPAAVAGVGAATGGVAAAVAGTARAGTAALRQLESAAAAMAAHADLPGAVPAAGPPGGGRPARPPALAVLPEPVAPPANAGRPDPTEG